MAKKAPKTVEDLLKEAGVTDATIGVLTEQDMLDATSLTAATRDDLKDIGIILGQAIKIKGVYPSADTSAPATAATPQQINVQLKQSYREMNVQQLFDALAADPNDDEALSELQSRDQYLKAAAKTENLAVVGKDNDVNVSATLKYWQYLKKPGSTAQTRFQGMRTTTIEKALGRKEKLMLHPFYTGKQIYMGIDDWGNDWSAIDLERMEAVLWARTTGHQMFPKDIDPMDAYEALSETSLTRRYQVIVEDYRAYKEEGGSVSLVVVEGGSASSASPFRGNASGNADTLARW